MHAAPISELDTDYTPRYIRLARLLRRQIEDGTYTPWLTAAVVEAAGRSARGVDGTALHALEMLVSSGHARHVESKPHQVTGGRSTGDRRLAGGTQGRARPDDRAGHERRVPGTASGTLSRDSPVVRPVPGAPRNGHRPEHGARLPARLPGAPAGRAAAWSREASLPRRNPRSRTGWPGLRPSSTNCSPWLGPAIQRSHIGKPGRVERPPPGTKAVHSHSGCPQPDAGTRHDRR